MDSMSEKFFQDWRKHKIFAFHGELGSGKTTFISALLKIMNVDNIQGSPTYSIINSYESQQYGTIYHADCYRINNIQEAYDIGFEELLYESDAYFFIEWPKNIESILPPHSININITVNASNERTLYVYKNTML